MKLYIVRHGQVPHNALNQHTNPEEDLTELGIKQAEEVRDKLKDIKFDVIISSPFVRTRHTTNIININNYNVIYDDRIRERNCGNLSGRSYETTNREEYWNYYTDIQQGTSENIRIFFERVYDFIEELKQKNYNCVLVVAHSGVSKAFSGYFEGINDGMFLNRGLKNCEIKEYNI